MRDVAAIIAPAVDLGQIEREIQREIVAMQDADRAESAAVERVEKTAEAARRQRVVVGQRLVEAKRAVKHGQWLPFLERLGVTKQRASEWMRIAGFVEDETKSPTSASGGHLNPPTLADAGIDRRPRKRDEEPHYGSDSIAHDAASNPNPSLDISRDLAKLTDKICSFAESIADKRYRALVVNQLRETARLIEEMP